MESDITIELQVMKIKISCRRKNVRKKFFYTHEYGENTMHCCLKTSKVLCALEFFQWWIFLVKIFKIHPNTAEKIVIEED